MSDIKKTLEDYPDISFINNLTLQELSEQMIADFETKYKEETGKEITLAAGDRNRIILNAAALQLYQGFQYIERAGRQSYLKYAYGDFLENLGAQKGITRNEGERALTTMRLTVSEAQESAISIPRGTRCTAGDNIYFETTEAAEIKPGEEYADVPAQCMEAGSFANGYGVGKINVLVDTIPYINSVANTKETAGGADEESDESLADRIYLAPAGYSTAGPSDAYEFRAKSANSEIGDVKVTSPEPGVVDIRFIMSDGSIPEEMVIAEVQDALSAKETRPLTDCVRVSEPDACAYSIDLTYWINESDREKAQAIQENVKQAIQSFQIWQSEKIGRDINPNKLLSLIIQAGARRAEIRQPQFTEIEETGIAVLEEEQAIYGGLEDD